MSAQIDLATSRPLGVAERLLGRPLDPKTVYSKLVVLTGEPEWLQSRNGHWCFVDCVRLLSRVVGHLLVVVPPGVPALKHEVAGLCAQAWSIESLEVKDNLSDADLRSAHAVLNIGSRVSGPSWISINSSGWVARISTSRDLSGKSGADNPMAALMAASLGVAEVFKRIFQVPVAAAPPIGFAEFSLFDLSATPTEVGPPLPESIELNSSLLVGGGAIGNGIVLLAAQGPFTGELTIIDKQDFQEENRGTCILLERDSWLLQSKAERLSVWLRANSSLVCKGFRTTIEQAIEDGKPYTINLQLLMAGLDEASPRRAAQRLWPEVLVDGGINEVGAAVTQHRLSWEGAACIQCWFEPPLIDEKHAQSQVTGLPRSSLDDLSRELTEADIAAAPESKREWLKACLRERKTLCSVITEGQMAARLDLQLENGFRPSVPFVATAAAALVMAEVVKSLHFSSQPSPQLFQFGSLFLGPDINLTAKRTPNPGCQCVAHRSAIREMKETMRNARP